jgi:hypothetical protein
MILKQKIKQNFLFFLFRGSSFGSGTSMEDNGNGTGRSTQNNNRSSSNMLNKLNNVFRGGDHRGSVSGTGLNGKSVFGSNLSIFSKVSRNVRPRRASRIRRSNSKQSFLSAEPNVERGAIMSKVILLWSGIQEHIWNLAMRFRQRRRIKKNHLFVD